MAAKPHQFPRRLAEQQARRGPPSLPVAFPCESVERLGGRPPFIRLSTSRAVVAWQLDISRASDTCKAVC